MEHRKAGKSIFLFATLDGTISAWNPTVDGVSGPGASHATIAVDRSKVGAVYSGLAIATETDGQTFLYAADDGQNRRVDMFDGTFTLVKSFNDPAIPQNFAPYGIQTINGDIWVTYAALNNAPGGFVDVFHPNGRLKKHLAVQGPLNSPWGLAQAPADFGPMSKRSWSATTSLEVRSTHSIPPRVSVSRSAAGRERPADQPRRGLGYTVRP